MSDVLATLQLVACPQCGYRLEGLPAAHRCPECGFAYDEKTFVLTGISRGAGGLSGGRRLLWIVVAVVATFGPSCLPLLLTSGPLGVVVLAAVGGGWVVTVVYLLVTGKQEKRGMEQFLFTAGGFGRCGSLHDSDLDVFSVQPWQHKHAIRLTRKSPRWRRSQIGWGIGAKGMLNEVVFDAVVRCDDSTADLVDQVLRERVAMAQALPDSEQDAAADDSPDGD